ncbi:MAG: YraN family protein [Terriglobales bacterium]
MLSGRLTQTTLRALDWLSAQLLPPDKTAGHLQTGRRGEEAAYFYLRRHGYTIIARNFRSPNHRGELDLVGWVREKGKDQNDDILCFIEVKTRTTRAVKPAEAAVDREKQDDLRHVARDFLRHLPGENLSGQPSVRFDVLAVYYDRDPRHPTFELFQNAFPLAYNRGLARYY